MAKFSTRKAGSAQLEEIIKNAKEVPLCLDCSEKYKDVLAKSGSK